MRKIIYYQTFCDIKNIKNTGITHIHVSSIHFGVNNNNKYIHLNNYNPYNKIFDNVWTELEEAHGCNINIILMVGGAGGGYRAMFNSDADFEQYYSLLKNLITTKKIISGIDLDVEEQVSLENIKKLITKINSDFGNDFIISMAPIQYALETNTPGLGGFIYKDLIESTEGKKISYLNTQFYNTFSLESYEKIIQNGYSPNKIIMGMIASNPQTMKDNYQQLKETYNKYKTNFGGTFLWEYYLDKNWINDIDKILSNQVIK